MAKLSPLTAALLFVTLGCGSSAVGNPDDGPDGGSDTTPPVLSDGAPSGALPAGTTAVTMTVTTDEAATCRWALAADTAFSDMADVFVTTGGTAHSTAIEGLADGQSYSRFVRCSDAAGNANLESYAVAFSVEAAGLGSATLIWEAPTTYTDGTPFTELGGYNVYYGTASGTYSATEDVGLATCAEVGGVTECTYTVGSLGSGPWYFVVTAYTTTGEESDYSNEASKNIP